MITSSVCMWMCTPMGCLWVQDKGKSHSCPFLAVVNQSWWFYPKYLPKCTNNFLTNCHNVTGGTTQRMAAVGCFHYCWAYLQWYRDHTLLIPMSKTAALFVTKIGTCFCWFPWWQQLFDLYDYFFLFIWPTSDQNLPHAVVSGTPWKWPFGFVCSIRC